MQITIFGATGSLGVHLVSQALEAGHSVTVVTRNANKLSSLTDSRLTVIQGDVRNEADVEKAITGKEAVLCALGDGASGKIRATGTANIIRAMEKTNCRRLICQTTLGMGESWNNLNFFWKRIMFGFFLKKAFQDHQQQETYVQASQLNYTLVRPSAFTDDEISTAYRINFDSTEQNLKLKISRADVAAFMLKQLESDAYHRQAVSISA
ncbi:MAG: SDR family oxidoreductase [Cyclobacteriaceae bacterium]|nr:SDR family oxidoreductase [Cyclobacteriaceae bacterium]